MKRRRYSKLISAVYSTPWAIVPQKLDEICGVLQLRQQGIKLTREEIRARVGDVEHKPLVVHHVLPGVRIVSDQALSTQPRIAVLNLHGTIAQRMNLMMEYSGGTSTELFGKAFDQAVADDSVVAIVIDVDSPGGTVPGTRELAEKIYAARGIKPVVSIANPMMASAAFWIATAAEEVVATPSAWGIGSVGVLYVHREDSKANAAAGETYNVLRSVEQKAAVNSWEPLSETARKDLQENITKIHTEFVAAVAKHRGVKVSAVDEQFGEGRAFQAEDALARGMIDRITTFEALLVELSGRADAQSPSPAAKKRRTPTSKDSEMDPKVKLALVRAGLVKATGTAEEFQAALALFYAGTGKPASTEVAQILADLEPAAPTLPNGNAGGTNPPNPGTTAGYGGTSGGNGGSIGGNGGTANPAPAAGGLSMVDINGLVATAGGMLSAEERLTLLTELQRAHATTPLSLTQVLDKINEKAVAANPPAGQRVTVTADHRDKFAARARDAILCHAWQGNNPTHIYDFRTAEQREWKPAGADREYGLMSPIKLGMQCLIACGAPASKVMGLSKVDVARLMCGARAEDLGLGGFLASSDGPAYNVSGMFSNILLDATNVLLRRSYDQGRSTFQLWMRKGPSIEDFKPVHRVIAGELGDPKAVPEDGEFEETTLTDGKESYKLTVWGQILSYSWQLLVNDALGMITEFPMKQGQAMRRKQNRLAYAVIKDNAALADTVALFSNSTHNNVTTGVINTVALYVAAWNTMAKKMSEQRGLDSNSAALGLSMRNCIFPPALRGIILQALGSGSGDATNPGLINVWQQGMRPIEEPELGLAAGGSDTAHYTAADSNDVDTIEYAHLQGLEAPRIEQETAFDRLAIKQRIYHAFGVKALDYRGLQQHTGA